MIFDQCLQGIHNCQASSTHSRVFSKTEIFFSEYGYLSYITGVLGTKNGGFQIRSSGWRFLKTEIHHIRIDGRKRRFSNTMTSGLGSRLALPHIRFENATCGRRVF